MQLAVTSVSFNLGQYLSLVWCFEALMCLESTDWLFHRMSLNLGLLSAVSFWLDLDCTIFVRNHRKVMLCPLSAPHQGAHEVAGCHCW